MLDAISSEVGHGAPGIRYGLRPFRDLLKESVGQRHLWVELRPKKVYATWTSEGSGVYSKAVSEVVGGLALDVVGVRTLAQTLSRVESQSLCTAGKFYYSGSVLYIHLAADANPSGTTVIAELGVYVGTHGVHQPTLLSDKLANGNLDAWTGAAPNGWTTSVGGGVTLDKTASDPLQGSYAARFTFANAQGQGSLYEAFAAAVLVPGMPYRVSGAYRSSTPLISASLYVWDTVSAYLKSDGRTIGSGPIFSDAPELYEWRRFSYDFICPSWANLQVYLLAQSSVPATGTLDFDDVRFQPIARYSYHEPLMDIKDVPSLEAQRADAFWGEFSSSLGSVSLANNGRLWYKLLALFDWLGATITLRVGGKYWLNGNEVPIEDCPIMAVAKMGKPRVGDVQVTFDLADDRSILIQTVPLRTYNNNQVDAYTQPDRGRARAILFGKKTGVRPVQVDIDYPSGGPVPLGVYEMVDVTGTPNGLYVPLTVGDLVVYWYLTDEAATARRVVERIKIDDILHTSAFNFTMSTGRLNIKRDMRPLVITAENNKIYFGIGGGTLTAAVTPGTYYLYDFEATVGVTGFLKALQDAMNTAAGISNITCTFVDSTQKVQISRGSSQTLSLFCQSGSDAQNGLWAMLGFDAAADKTGLFTYNADYTFTGQAYQQIIRVDVNGFRDDGSGTYTGSANAVIEKPGDIARFILAVFFNQTVDPTTFVAARSSTWGDRPCSLYIGAPRTLASVLSELETSGHFDLVLRAGVWYCVTRDTSVPAGTPELVDADYLDFECVYEPEDLYGTVTLTYNEAPDGGDPIPIGRWHLGYQPHSRTEMGEVTDSTIALRFDRAHSRLFKTCLRDPDDAAFPLSGSRLEALANLAKTKRRRFLVTTKGKCLTVPPSGKVILNRTRGGLDTTGVLSNVLVQVIRKQDDWARWTSEFEAIEVV